MTKIQAKVKQRPEAELLLFEHYSLSSSTLSSKNKRRHEKNAKKQENENRSHRYDIN